MGDAADPVTGERHYDLVHAAEAIDLLALLREKTEGHRSVEETQVLEGLIYDLQLRYVEATKRAGSPPGPPRSCPCESHKLHPPPTGKTPFWGRYCSPASP